MVYSRRKNIFTGSLQIFYNSFYIGRKIKLTPSLIFLLSLLLIIFIIFVWRTDFFALKNLLVFLMIGSVFIVANGLSYYVFKKRSDIYNLEAIEFAQDRLIVIYNNSSVQKEIFYKNILKISFGGYNTNFLAKNNLLYARYEIKYEGSDGKTNELLIPMDLVGLSELLINVIVKTGLKKVISGDNNLLYEWRKINAAENVEIAKVDDINPLVADPNKSLSSMFSGPGKNTLHEVSGSTILLVLAFLAIFLYIELVSLKFIN